MKKSPFCLKKKVGISVLALIFLLFSTTTPVSLAAEGSAVRVSTPAAGGEAGVGASVGLSGFSLVGIAAAVGAVVALIAVAASDDADGTTATHHATTSHHPGK